MTRRYKRGFTLMELMIVIALIAILAVAGSGSYLGSLKRGRDTRRKSDVKQIQKALELYMQDQSIAAYPLALSDISACNIASTYMSKMPCNNFTTSREYIYVRGLSDTATYTLTACLENATDDERDAVPNADCGGNASYTIIQP